MSDDELIRKHITRRARATPDDARLVEYGVHMWALAGCVPCRPDCETPIDAMMADYHISREAAEAAEVYITRHRRYIDARLLLMGMFDGDELGKEEA